MIIVIVSFLRGGGGSFADEAAGASGLANSHQGVTVLVKAGTLSSRRSPQFVGGFSHQNAVFPRADSTTKKSAEP